MAIIWNKRKSARWLWSTLVIATFVLCIAFIYISFSIGKKYNFARRNSVDDYTPSSERLTEECISVCDSKECVQQSKILLDNVQPDVNPCDDFYKFACGQFLDKRAPDEISNFMTRYLDQMMRKLKGILDNLDAKPNSASDKMKIVYDSCMKYGYNEIHSVPTILQIFNSFGILDWPNLFPDFTFVNSSLPRLIGNLLAFQEYGFVRFSKEYEYWQLEPDSQINLSLTTGQSYYGQKKQLQRKYLVDCVLNYFNLDPETINGIWEESEAIHAAIINLRQESEIFHEENENSTALTMDCTQNKTEWRVLCESLESFVTFIDANKEINKNYANILGQEVYFMQNIFLVLSKFSDKSIANYLALNVFFKHLIDLNFYFRLMRQKDPHAHIILDDSHIPISRWQHCVRWIASHMTLAIAHEFTKKDFTVTVMEEVQNITKELIQETAESISRQKWISDAVLSVMTEKIENIFVVIEKYIELFPNETYVNEFYKEFHPADGSFLHNVLEFGKFMETEQMRGCNMLDKINWLEPLFIPGASGGGGEITINFGIMLPPTYLPRLQRLINLVSLGIIVAHEIGHNMQSFYRVFMRVDQAAKDYYDATTQCIANQFSKFRLESIGKNLNGSRYSHENNADNIAIQVIDKVIEKYVSDGEEISLPAFPYSSKQVLYISAAQMWCSVYSKKKYELIYHSGFHSPTNLRLLGILQNSKGFSKAFDCPEGSYMNPSNKCLLLTESD